MRTTLLSIYYLSNIEKCQDLNDEIVINNAIIIV